MTKRSFVSLFLKMVAIYAAVRTIPALVSLGTSLHDLHSFGFPESFVIVLSSVVAMAIFVTLMILVISKSDRIATRFISDDDSPMPLGTLTSEEIQALAFSWIGLWVLISGVSGTLQNVAYLVRIKAMVAPEQLKLNEVQGLPARLVSDFGELLAGAYLFLYPRGLARLWHSMQGKGTSNKGVQRDAGSAGAPDA